MGVRLGDDAVVPSIVWGACAASLAIGLFFVFVWAPQPWGWRGFDHYHEIALDLAAGRPFPTMEVPWGYAYFLAFWYRLIGVRPRAVLTQQAILNAAVPALVFLSARHWVSRPTAAWAAAFTGVLSFNTIYASTESSDAVCTVLFMTAVYCFTRALRERSVRWFAAAGVLAGTAAQFRPNLILLPLVLGAFVMWSVRTKRSLLEASVVVASAAAALTPWIVRNYNLTGMLVPTSVHGGVQLWYGTLETGPYLRSRAYNPRSVFEASAFDYTSLADVPLIVDAKFGCADATLIDAALVWWSDADPTPRRTAATSREGRRYTFEIAPPHHDAVVYYYVVSTWAGDGAGKLARTAPVLGPRAPAVYFVSNRHLADMDAHDDLLDVFDVVRLARRKAWHEPLAAESRLREAGVHDVGDAVARLLEPVVRRRSEAAAAVEWDPTHARITMFDGSSIAVPREWSGRITDLEVTRGAASTLMTSRRSLRELAIGAPRPAGIDSCLQAAEITVNDVFYRREPHMMRRYAALALDNIRRNPIGFAAASAYRAVRMFIVAGAADTDTALQFAHSGRIYAAATAVSIVFLIVCGWGVVAGIRGGAAIGLPLLLIAYVPLTLAPVLINMRYTVTVQPLMFVFAAISARRAAEAFALRSPRDPRSDGSETA
ncbi:MAG TPA: glycosyltransferase family 39 protein [Vicinamibacterales bacterium]|nr:glycosyltransferase family 39 protein [Vicinamibacterales bacterium]